MTPLHYYDGFRLVTPDGEDPLRALARSMHQAEVTRETPEHFVESKALAKSIREASTVKIIHNLDMLLDDRNEKLKVAARLLKAA